MDIHILAQGIVYFCMSISGLVISVTIGVNRGRFGGQCILYAPFNDQGIMHSSSASNCNFPLYVSVFGLVLRGLVMGIYYVYSFIRSKQEPNRGSAMWAMPTLLIDGVLFIHLLVSACIVSVGYAVFCSNYLESYKKNTKCSDGENTEWHFITTGKKFNPGNYVAFMNTCMIFAWIGLLFVSIQLCLSALRVYRNRHPSGHPGATELESNIPT